MKAYRILVVEDDEDIVETVKFSLEIKGFVVDVAYDGLQALRKARKERYDLMLLDIMLPGKNGYEVSRILKEEMEQQKIEPFKILVLTARKVASPEREDFLSTWSKADEFMYKPFDMDDLIDRIRKHIEGGMRTAGRAVQAI
jgi:DNA-binding response OmpR family regulator